MNFLVEENQEDYGGVNLKLSQRINWPLIHPICQALREIR